MLDPSFWKDSVLCGETLICTKGRGLLRRSSGPLFSPSLIGISLSTERSRRPQPWLLRAELGLRGLGGCPGSQVHFTLHPPRGLPVAGAPAVGLAGLVGVGAGWSASQVGMGGAW